MDIKDLADARRRLGIMFCQDIRKFERKTGMEVIGIKIDRNEQGIESVTVKVELLNDIMLNREDEY